MLRQAIADSLKRRYKSSSKSPSKTSDTTLLERKLVDKFQKKAVRVTILGGCTRAGEALSMLLKINPLVSHLYLQGDNCRGLALDLSHIDTRTMVSGFYENDVDKAVRRAEIVVMLPVNQYGDHQMTAQEKFRNEYIRLIKLTRSCTLYAPKAIMYVCVPPVSMSVPLVAGVFKKTHWYHPGRIIGSVDLYQVMLNTMAARFNDLDPAGFHVPIVGGPDQDSIVPLFSRATPIECADSDAEQFTKEIRKISKCEPVTYELKKMEFSDASPLAQAFAVNRSITTMALGILGDPNAHMSAFIRSDILKNTCKHLVSTVRICSHGVYHNYGLPILTPMELRLMERAALLVHQREEEALRLLESVDEKKVAKAN